MRSKVSNVSSPRKSLAGKRMSPRRKSKTNAPQLDSSEELDFLTQPGPIIGSASSSSVSETEDSRSKRTTPRRTSNKSKRKSVKPKKRKTHVLRDILLLQRTQELILAKAPFLRCVREVINNFKQSGEWRITKEAISALQESVEMYLVQLFEDSYACTLHRGRATLQVKDMEIVKFLRGVCDPGNQ